MRPLAALLLAAMAVCVSAIFSAGAQTVAVTAPTEMTEQNDTGTSEKEHQAKDAEPFDDAPDAAISVEHVDMIVEDQMVSVRSRDLGDGRRQFNLSDIAPALQSRIETNGALLGYHRAQDGVLMSIHMADGKVRSNKTVLGKLPSFEPREAATAWLGLNAVTIMTGTNASKDAQGRTVLQLDERLKPRFGLELWVNGVPIDTFEDEPRTIGAVLLVPLKPIVDALGHELTVTNGTVTVRRQQDQASINLELSTGLISVNSTPRGVTPDMQLADRDGLILPFGAVEALTGTHIKLTPLSNRVDVRLDTRLDSNALPGARVSDEALSTPFTLEALQYDVSDRGPLRLETQGHWSKYGFRTQLETAGGLENLAKSQPGWVSADIASMDGWTATVGDYNSTFREVTSVGVNRMRGLSWRTQQPSGAIVAIAAGVPLSGVKQDSTTVSVPTFDGFTVGARRISEAQDEDIGIAVRVSDDGGEASVVLNGQKSYDFALADHGLQSAYIAGGIGVFTGQDDGADIRFRASANYTVNDQTGLSGSLNYEGAKFASGANSADFAGVFDQRNGARTNVSVGASWRADRAYGAVNRLALSVRGAARHQGGDAKQSSTSLNAAASAQIGTSGPLVSAIALTSTEQSNAQKVKAESLRLRAVQRFGVGTLSAVYAASRSDEGDTKQQFVATAQANPWHKTLGKGATVKFAPNATLNWDGEEARANAGAAMIVDSGRAFGAKLHTQARLSAFSDFTSEEETADRTRFLGSIEARYQLSRNAMLTAIYSDDFSGRSDLSIGIRGAVSFNPPRASRLPDEGKGVLAGRVFLDRNRDGVRQDDEPGVPGVRVQVIGTRLGLNTARDGHFNIQNIKQGLYAVTVSRQSLPLGYLVSEATQPRVTVGNGRRTEVEIPLILSGQVRGAVFVDENGNGQPDAGERRLEGQWLQLKSLTTGATRDIHSASFGQYGFESVDPGEYELSASIAGTSVSQTVLVDVASPFAIVPLAVPPAAFLRGSDLDLGGGVLGEP